MSEATTNVFNPFPGLRPFRTDEDYLFFGREAQTAELLTLLRMHRFLAVVGTSGSGKSSLVRAGLLPELQGGTMNVAGSEWEIVLLRPGGNPNLNLAQAILDANLYDADDTEMLPRLMATLHRSGRGLVEAFRQSQADPQANLLVVVDQFEEIFRYQQTSTECRDQALAFVNLLLEASQQQECSIYVVLTMRSDYLGDCSQFRGLAEAVNRGEYLIPRLSRTQLQAAIEGPVKVGGGEIAYRLVQHLLNDVGDDPDQLPLLQHALMRTWAYWVQDHLENEPVDLRHYEGVGGMAEALTRHADEVLESLPNDNHRLIAERIFQTLTEKGNDNRGIRRANRLTQIARITGTDESVVATVVDAYRRPGVTFLMPPGPEPLTTATVIDLSHESLMRAWFRLRRWVDEEAQSARVYRRLAETAALWRNGRAGLYHDPDLQIAQTWRDERKPNEAWAGQYGGGFDDAMQFLDASRAAADATRRAGEEARQRELVQAKRLAETQARAARNFKVFTGVLAVFGLLAVSLSIWALRLSSVAQRHKRDADSLRLAAEQASQQAFADADAARVARRQAEGLLVQSRHEQGSVWLELARSLLSSDKNHLGAKLLAARAIGFEGYGRKGQPKALQDTYPVLLKRNTTQWRDAEQLIRFEPEFPTIWRSPSSALPAPVRGLCFSPDGTRLASCGVESVVRLWDTVSGDQIGVLEGDFPPEQTWSVCFSPDNRRLAIAAGDSLRLWTIDPPEEITRFDHGDNVHEVAFNHDGSLLASACDDHMVYVWDVASRQRRFQLQRHQGSVRSVCFQPGTNLLASAAQGGAIYLWNADTGQRAGQLVGHDQTVRCLRFRPDGQLIASGGDDRTVRLWQVGQSQQVGQIDMPQEVYGLAFSRDGTTLAAGGTDGDLHLVDAQTQELVASMEGHTALVHCVQFNLDGTQVASGGNDSTLRMWNVADRQERLTRTGHRGRIRWVAFSPDGTLLASAGQDRSIRVWDLKTGVQSRLIETEAAIGSIEFTPDGKSLISCSLAGAIQIWDLESGSETANIRSLGAAVTCISPDGRLLAGACGDNTVRIWNLATGEEPRELRGHTAELRCVAFHPNGRLVASSGNDGTVRIWDVGTGQQEQQLDGPTPNLSVRISPDGTQVAAAGVDRVIRVWELASGRQALSLNGHEAAIGCLDIGPRGDWLASGDEDGVIRLWKLETGEHIATLLGHQGTVDCLAFAPDGRTLASAGSDQGVRLWEVVTPRIAELAKGPVVFNQDGTQLACGGPESMTLVDALTDRQTAVMEDVSGYRTKMRFTADGKYLTALVVGSQTSEQVLWEVEDERQVMTVGGLNAMVQADFSPDSTTLAIPANATLVNFVEVATGEVASTLTTPNTALSCCYDPSGKQLAVGGAGGSVSIWNLQSRQLVLELSGHAADIVSIDFSQDGKLLATGDVLGKLNVWTVSTANRLATLELSNSPVFDVRFSPDDGVLAAVSGGNTFVWDVSARTMVAKQRAQIPYRVLSFDPQGTLLSSGYRQTDVLSCRKASDEHDYARYLRDYRFEDRGVDSTPNLNLYREQHIPLEPKTAISHVAVLRTDDAQASRSDLFQRYLAARNLSAANFVLQSLSDQGSASQRELLAKAMLGAAGRAIAQGQFALATRWLDEAETYAPANSQLWIARSQLLQAEGRPEEALAMIQEGIQRATVAGEQGRPHLFTLAHRRMTMRLEAGQLDAARDDLDFLIALPELSSPLRRRKLLFEYLDAKLKAEKDESATTNLLLACAMIKGLVEAEIRASVDLDALPELQRLLAASPDLAAKAVLIAKDSSWKYHENGSQLAAGWHDPQFDDSGWPVGPAPLGFGDGREKTSLTPGSVAYYFRQRFTLDPETNRQAAELVLNLVRDDGAVIYLNGNEVLRDNIPQGDVGPESFAQSTVSGAGETAVNTHRLPARLLIPGDNLLAVEVHQINRTSTDVRFDLQMQLSRPVSALLLDLSPPQRDQALETARSVLPASLAQEWTGRMRFAYQPALPADDPALGDPQAWRIRHRLQVALHQDQQALLALAHEHALLAAQEDETATLRRAEIVAQLRQLAEQLPVDPTSATMLERTMEVLAPSAAQNQQPLRVLAERNVRIQLALEDVPATRRALGVLLQGELEVPVTTRSELVRQYLDLAAKPSVEAIEGDEAAWRNVLLVALLKLYESALQVDPVDLEQITEWSLLMKTGSDATAAQVLVDKDAVWKYNETGVQPSTSWKEPNYDDSQWRAGPGPFGFGDNTEKTTLTRGQLTYHLRHGFTAQISQIPKDAGLVLNVARDDGMVVYLNGHEILRDNMPPGAINDQTRATSTVGGDNETRVYKFSVPGVNQLRDGQNVLAVELHQAGTNSSDTYLDITLSTERRTSWFIANLPEETLDQALAAAGEILPEGLVDSWTSALRFALAPTVSAESATDVDARQWMARARIQQALGRYAEALAALNRELELLRSNSSTAAVVRRYSLELEVEQVFIQLGQSQEVHAWWSQRFADELATMRAYRINCGGSTFLDAQGDIWGADRRFLTGATSNLGGEIEGTDDDELYRTHRWSFNPNNSQDLRLYSLPAPNGSYQVTLLFADTQSPRSVDVMLEDRVVLQGYDIVQAVGARQADRRSFQITVSDGQLDIGFSTQSGSALVSGIEVTKLD